MQHELVFSVFPNLPMSLPKCWPESWDDVRRRNRDVFVDFMAENRDMLEGRRLGGFFDFWPHRVSTARAASPLSVPETI